MQVVHESAGQRRTLATDVEFADSLVSQAVGLMGRSSLPEGYALVFRFDPPPWPLSRFLGAVRDRSVHMLFVRTPLDVVWLADGEVQQVSRLQPWRGHGSAPADTVIELPAGAAEGVAVGDDVRLERPAE